MLYLFLVVFLCLLLASSAKTVTLETLEGFFDAFNRHDVDGVLSFMSEDCEFHAIAGDDKLGKTFVGKSPLSSLSLSALPHVFDSFLLFS